jgi:hypothetical protein
VRIAVLCGAWLPFLGMFLLFLPKFEPIFNRLAEKGELPALTAFFVALGRLNSATFGLPILAFFVWLIVADLGAAWALQNGKGRRAVYWLWFATVLFLALLACLLLLMALLLPVFKMSSTVA